MGLSKLLHPGVLAQQGRPFPHLDNGVSGYGHNAVFNYGIVGVQGQDLATDQ